MKTVILFSGGIDSTVCLARYASHNIFPLFVEYGQRHLLESVAADDIARHYSLNITRVIVSSLLRGRSTTDYTIPGRNAVLLSLAAVHAASVGADCIVIGCNADDARSYADCKPRYIEGISHALGISIHAPLSDMTKAEVVTYGRSLSAPLHMTWSCYDPQPTGPNGERNNLRAYAPCCKCGACILRSASGL